MATLEVAMKTSIGGWFGLEVSVATAITVVCDIIDGHLLFGIHDLQQQQRLWCDVKREEVGRERSSGGM